MPSEESGGVGSGSEDGDSCVLVVEASAVERRGRPAFALGAKRQVVRIAAQLWHALLSGGRMHRIFRRWQYSHAPRTLG